MSHFVNDNIENWVTSKRGHFDKSCSLSNRTMFRLKMIGHRKKHFITGKDHFEKWMASKKDHSEK